MEGQLACEKEEHQAIERLRIDHGQSRFQLSDRLARAHVSHPNDSSAEDVALKELIDDVDDEQGEASAAGEPKPKKIRAQFGCKRTHNEQIIVAPCGMIIAQETFYGAEAVSSVVEMVKHVYCMDGTMPNHIFFDNNCSLAKIVKDDPVLRQLSLILSLSSFVVSSKAKLSCLRDSFFKVSQVSVQ
jgi:hypothetical protein